MSAYSLKKMVFNETETETESQFQCECEFDAVLPKPNGLKVDQSNPGPLEKNPHGNNSMWYESNVCLKCTIEKIYYIVSLL